MCCAKVFPPFTHGHASSVMDPTATLLETGYWADVERLGLEESNLGTSSINPGSLYGPDGVPYAPWMVGKVSEGRTKKRPSTKTEEELKFEYDGRGQVLVHSSLLSGILRVHIAPLSRDA